MTIILPSRQSKSINQNNRSKILGDIWSSFNLDLQSELGLIKVSPRLRINTTGVTNQGLSVAFSAFDANVFSISGTRVFKNSSKDLVSSFVEDASSGAITDYDPNYSDMTHFNNLLFTSSKTKIMSKAQDGSGTGAWTSRYSLTTATCNHKLCYFTGTNRLYFIDDFSCIKSMDTSYSTATSASYFINIPFESGGVPYTLIADKTNIWIGMSFLSGNGGLDTVQHASILVWDGISSTVTSEYKIKAKAVLALSKDDNGVIHAIDSNGSLLRFNGSGFAEIDRLPLNKKYLINAIPDGNGNFDAFIHPNGFYFTRNGTFIVLINNLVGDNAGTIKENLASGIWEWSKNTGFVHKQSFSYNQLGSIAVTDYGQNRVSSVGALYEANIYSTSSTGKPTLICGGTYYTNSSTTASAIFVDDPLDTIQKYGYFITSWIPADGVTDAWNKFSLKYRNFLNSTDKIICKYRLTESASTEISITWNGSETSFTTSTDMTGKEGYEVEVIQGTGSGKCAHISSVTSNTGIYTVSLDESFTGVTSGTAKARIQNWIKFHTIADQYSESKSTTIGKSSQRIQLKVCMQFTGENELHELVLNNEPHEPLE
jgi:hypothetical protein